MKPTVNNGVIITGGAVNASAIVAGTHARAVVNGARERLDETGNAEIARQLKAVLAAIDTDGAALPNQKSAYELVAKTTTELTKTPPDKLTLQGFLSGLADEVKSVASIAATVGPLVVSVMGFFL